MPITSSQWILRHDMYLVKPLRVSNLLIHGITRTVPSNSAQELNSSSFMTSIIIIRISGKRLESGYAIVQSNRSHSCSTNRLEDVCEDIVMPWRNISTTFETYGVDGAGHPWDCCLRMIMKRVIPRRQAVEIGNSCCLKSFLGVESRRCATGLIR